VRAWNLLHSPGSRAVWLCCLDCGLSSLGARRIERVGNTRRADPGRNTRSARRCSAICCDQRSRRNCAAPRRPGAHHAEEGLRRRDGRGRHGPLVAPRRLATSVPPPHFHTVHGAGVIASAHPWRGRLTRICPLQVPNPADIGAAAHTAHGQSSCGARSPWTSSAAPVARDG
jgi:hypothetical protein